MTDPRPDLIIGIDFGMTCKAVVYKAIESITNAYFDTGTGVAYAFPSSGVETVRHIQKWPGRMQANEDKVRQS
jgi:hypothetical protein